ncbi:MAG TPA: hypothetical protein VF702_07480 [Allosphingosinicella sp.]|jgi:hypothetical protein
MVQFWTASGRESDVEVYRASHHGSRYSSAVPFLAALDPEVAVYSAHHGHGHPNAEAIERMRSGVRHYATGLDPAWGDGSGFRRLGGEVVDEVQIFVLSNGSRYTVNGTSFRSFSDAEERSNRDQRP